MFSAGFRKFIPDRSPWEFYSSEVVEAVAGFKTHLLHFSMNTGSKEDLAKWLGYEGISLL